MTTTSPNSSAHKNLHPIPLDPAGESPRAFPPRGSRNALGRYDGVYVIKTTRSEQVTGDGEVIRDAVTFFGTVTARQVLAAFLFPASPVFPSAHKSEYDMITREKIESVRRKAQVRSAKLRENDSANMLPTAREIDNALRKAIVLFLLEKDIFGPPQIGNDATIARIYRLANQRISQPGPQFENA
jgi:hypothetical protein